jgi:hypothetical protein
MRDAITAHLGSRQVSRVLYGSIIGLALVVALEAHPPRAGAIVVTLVATAIAVALAELYSEIVGTETRTRARVERQQVVDMVDEIGASRAGRRVPLPVLPPRIAALRAIDLDAAFTIAEWSGLGLIAAPMGSPPPVSPETRCRHRWAAPA